MTPRGTRTIAVVYQASSRRAEKHENAQTTRDTKTPVSMNNHRTISINGPMRYIPWAMEKMAAPVYSLVHVTPHPVSCALTCCASWKNFPFRPLTGTFPSGGDGSPAVHPILPCSRSCWKWDIRPNNRVLLRMQTQLLALHCDNVLAT